MTGNPTGLPPSLRAYLSIASLDPVWTAARARLERNGRQPTGTITAVVDDVAADHLSGLLGRPVAAGATRIKLADLDTVLRTSKAGRGIVSVLEDLQGRPVIDRRALRDQSQIEWAEVWQRLDAALYDAGLAGAPWAPKWIADLRRTGILTRAGAHAAGQALEQAVAGLALLLVPASSSGRAWELAALASQVTGTAHGLDDTTLASSVLLRAAAFAVDRPVPESAADRRELWGVLNVHTDMLSGTVLTWQLRPLGDDGWSRMLRERAQLGLVTHLTLHELAVAAPASWSEPGQVVSVCENPQVMQAAVRASTATPLLCLSGNPASAGTRLLRHLVTAGIPVRYHGDFDWPGVAIAGRVLQQGALPWRMAANDYLAAVAGLDGSHAVPLAGRPAPTPWDPPLAAAMSKHGLAVHEEFVLADLLADLWADDAVAR
ncbi:TIGR02679 family protein [Actinoplanes sp. L3-i22]|uniref:TIGR02679 family protein n=1 Tax=Actinoplanes sp. L3-i22 TaxID=2836373 RepID=UPI001C78865A|nr:TIGR02679 family protein [Actinoplanes sp. L3-i22]BCY13423.1 hypothetical protein L3i22_085110 [Actinoplanes sp. L3-i22]